MRLLVISLNVLGWPIIQIPLARLFLLLPDRYFSRDSWLTWSRRFEQNGRIYRRLLSIHPWKRLLPDGAAWFGGKRKREFANRRVHNLRVLATETRRGETAHWCMLLCTPIFYVWKSMVGLCRNDALWDLVEPPMHPCAAREPNQNRTYPETLRRRNSPHPLKDRVLHLGHRKLQHAPGPWGIYASPTDQQRPKLMKHSPWRGIPSLLLMARQR